MSTVIIPRDSAAVRCPECGATVVNLTNLGVRHQVDCVCGAHVVVDRRQPGPSATPSTDRRRQ